jgi:hypothetical protein
LVLSTGSGAAGRCTLTHADRLAGIPSAIFADVTAFARLWTSAGHETTSLGREGGDASNADVIVVAVPGGAIPRH